MSEAEQVPGPERRIRRWPVILASVVVALAIGLYQTRTFWAPIQPRITPIADVSSERLLALGSVVGFAADDEAHAWLGLPFALPPVDQLRWRAPRRPAAWADTRDALDFGRPCVQLGSMLGGVPAEDEDGLAGDEDCLYLNVWAPRVEAESVPTGDAQWPVMVFIHGGGNIRGYSGARMYDGAKLAGRENVIVVSIAYRVGPLGFFSHPALRSEADDAVEASGNFGLLDQISALEWVQSHIEEFGGNAANVTIFGQSAGGQDVFALLLAERSKGLFHRAIAQSGVLATVSRAEAENPVNAAEPGWRQSSAEAVVSLLERAGVVPDRGAARNYAEELPAVDLLGFLRSRSAREVLDVYRDPERPEALRVPKLIRDGALLPAGDWLEEMRAGRFHNVPILAGANRDEWKLYMTQDEDLVRQRFGVFFRVRDPESYERFSRLHSGWWAMAGVTNPLNALEYGGAKALFGYRFDWDELSPLLGQDASEIIGAAHGFELPLLFGSFDLGDPLLSRLLYAEEGRAGREELSRQMMAYWATFARSGDPGRGGGKDLPEWSAWNSGVGTAQNGPGRWMILDAPDDGGLRMSAAHATRTRLVAEIEADTSWDVATRCAFYEDLLWKHERLTQDALSAVSSGRCRLDR